MSLIIKSSIALFALSLFAGCSLDPTKTTETSALPDLTSLYAQVCEVKEGPCSPMMCSMQASGAYQCAENIAQIGQNCAPAKTMDDVITSYQICGKENGAALSIFSYAQTLENLHADMSPAQLEQKIKEETAAVENGGTSSFLSTMLATAGGMMLGGLISNALFGQRNAMPPMRPASAYEQPLTKSSLDAAKADTKANTAKIQNAVKQARSKASSSGNTTKKNNTSGNKTQKSVKKRK